MSRKSYTIIGTPFSTFTRTITLAFHYKNISFNQIAASPHSNEAKDAHPYGYLPTLIIEDQDTGVATKLSESQAIVRYLDRIAPNPTLHFQSARSHSAMLEERMWEVVSLAASFGFPIVEGGVVKPHMKALQDGTPEAEILKSNTAEVSKVADFFKVIEQRSIPETRFLFGEHPTWADFYMYPLLADLRALPEWEEASRAGRFRQWMVAMDELDSVKATFSGTLASTLQ